MTYDYDQTSDNDAVIQVKQLKKRFGHLAAVDGLSFEVYKGEIFGFLGPNGAGKTTTLNMLCGLLPPTSGQVTILGRQPAEHKNIKTQVGICPQENIFWPNLTCFEQLEFMGRMYDMPRQVARKRAGDLLERLGLETKIDVQAGKLSGGMKKRLNLSLALVHDPGILILDEPEVGLDPQSRVMVRTFIKNLAQEKTVVLSTHNMDEADRLSDRVAIIDHGKLLMSDTPENLKKSIGSGDIMQIDLDTGEESQTESLVKELKKICGQVESSANSLVFKSHNLIEAAVEIVTLVKKRGFKIRRTTMRENSLEDVFIHLTGRKLRQ